MLVALLLLQAASQVPKRSVPDPGVIATNQTITPAGVQSVFDGRVTGLKFGRDPRELWVAVPGNAWQLAWTDNRVLRKEAFNGRAGIYGLVVDPVTGRALVSTVGRVPAGVTRPAGITATTGNVAQLLSVEPGANGIPTTQRAWLGVLGRDAVGGPAVASRANSAGHRVVVIPLLAQNQLAVIDADNGAAISTVPLGVVPVSAVISGDGSTAWATEMAGTKPKAGDRTAKQCCEGFAEQIRVDERGIALPGTVSRIDVVRGIVTNRITVGRHPTALAWDTARGRLYVADGNDDRVTVINTRRPGVHTVIDIKPFKQRAIGLAPTAVALSPDGHRLFVALGGVNAVAVYDVHVPERATLVGLLPTGWYPSTLDVSSDGRFLAAGTLLGVGSGTGTTVGQTARYVHAVRGSVNVIEIPNAARFAAFSVAVAENNRLTLASAPGSGADALAARADVRPRAVPERPGEPSLIQHVVYIIRENRTYDQVLGALGRGDGDPSLVMYGRDVTPNTHALSEKYVTFDRMFASGGNSADGHQWLTQANETEYTLWPLYNGRSYPYDGSDALAYSSGGFIWDAAAARNKSVAVFGEFAPEKPDSGAPWRNRLLEEYRARRAGTGNAPIPTFNTTSEIPSLDRTLIRNFPTWTLGVPDVVRAEIFAANLKAWEAAGSMPNLVIIQLPSDHTTGTSADWSTPKASVADNDLATGQMVEALTKSSFWPSTAILVVEDDAQNGVDHVDGHRTVALAISPYTKRGVVDSTFYNAPSLLKTIELMLGLPSLSMFDLVASDMGAAFIGPDDAPDFAPYTAIEPAQSLYEVNPRPNQLRGAQRDAAVASAKMRFDVPDAAPSDRLNRILWSDARGWNTTYPGVKQGLFMPLSKDVDDEEREEARERAAKKVKAKVDKGAGTID
ncbi:MAG: bifunctional YncE family protein/alkaline phosphatase family protein [Longimicrobiales bacterium]